MKNDIDTVINVLNRALKADPGAVREVFAHRTPCNKDLAHDPTVQVLQCCDGDLTVGALGLINGIVEEMTGERVVAIYDDVGGNGFELVRFEVYNESDYAPRP